MRKYSYLDDFLSDKPCKNERAYSVPIRIECIKRRDDNKLDIQNPKCINCMFCAFGCIGNRVLITKEIHPVEMCVDITSSQIKELRDAFLPKLFHGEFIDIPPVPFSQIRAKYKTFEEFTAVDETQNIAVWGANAMKYLSTSLEPRISLEVGVDISARDRGGRLDISMLNTRDGYLFVAETKVGFKAMMDEQRYEAQMLAYETELQRTCPTDLKRCKFLLIGDVESDLLPFENKNCTGGNAARLFYDVLRADNLFFMSANAMLAMGLMKMFVSQERYSLESLYSFIASGQYVGLLSSGLVRRDGTIVPF